MSDLQSAIDKAYDYRGDVTVELKDGRKVVGYLFNREPKGTPRCREPFVELMVDGSDQHVLVRYAEIASVALTGEDAAAGKSWEEWAARHAAQKKPPHG